jgi:hypothetical protein
MPAKNAPTKAFAPASEELGQAELAAVVALPADLAAATEATVGIPESQSKVKQPRTKKPTPKNMQEEGQGVVGEQLAGPVALPTELSVQTEAIVERPESQPKAKGIPGSQPNARQRRAKKPTGLTVETEALIGIPETAAVPKQRGRKKGTKPPAELALVGIPESVPEVKQQGGRKPTAKNVKEEEEEVAAAEDGTDTKGPPPRKRQRAAGKAAAATQEDGLEGQEQGEAGRPKRARGRKKTAEGGGDAEGGDAVPSVDGEAAVKKPRGRKKKTVVEADDEGGGEDAQVGAEGEVVVKKERRKRIERGTYGMCSVGYADLLRNCFFLGHCPSLSVSRGIIYFIVTA